MSLMLGIVAVSGVSASAMTPIYSTTLASDTGTITINSIPNTYKHLQLFVSSRAVSPYSDSEHIFMRFNNNSNNIYSRHNMNAYGDRVFHIDSSINNGQFYIGRDLTQGATTNAFGGAVVSIWDYANPNTLTTIRSFYGHATAGSGGTYIVGLTGGAFSDTTAVSRIDLFKSNASFAANSTVTLMGIKA